MTSVLITGCSSGFGLETAVATAQRGWRVFASMRNLDKRGRLDAAAKEAGVGDRIEVLQLDVIDAASIASAAKEVLAATGGALDAVVHNAGVSSGGAFEEVPEEEWRRVFDTNLFGVLALTQALLPSMRERRRGRIVVVSSDNAFYGAPGVSIYAASKFALEGWAESLAYEVEPYGIHVICVEPGAYRTEIWDSSPRVLPPNSPYAGMAEIIQRFVDDTLVAHARDPREVADTIVKALTSSRPRFRYAVGPDARLMAFAHGVVPRPALTAGVRRLLGLARWRP